MTVWLFFIIGMSLRFFPSKFESMGCQKQFAKNYEPIGEQCVPTNQSWKRTALVAVIWLALNAVIGALYFTGIFDRGMLILIALAYSVCDIICILFFCPFQTWFMPEYALMRQFALEDDTTDLTSVREYLAVTKASVSQMLASLEKRGLLVRQIDPTNRRNLIVMLTSEGIERLRQKEFQVERRLRELLAELGETDALQFITLINKMNTVLSKKKEEH